MEPAECLRLIQILEDAYKLVRTPADIEKWVRHGTNSIRILNKILKNQAKTVGEKLRLQTTISQVQSILEKFRSAKKYGAGVRSERKLSDRVKWIDGKSVFQGRIRSGTVVNLQHKDLRAFLEDAKKMTTARLKNVLKNQGNLKVNGMLACKFQIIRNAEEIEETKYFNTRNEMILSTTDLSEWFNDNLTDRLLRKVQEFQEKDSGWALRSIINLMINVNRYEPLRGGLSTYVKLPKKIQTKKAVVNIENRDEYCFLWSVTAALYPTDKHSDRISSYPDFRSVLKYEGLTFPIALHSSGTKSDISKFEVMNELCVNIYGIDSESSDIVPLYVSKQNFGKTIHLLAVKSDIAMDTDDD